MTRNQFKNLVAFVIITGNHPKPHDIPAPDYLVEKFDRFLGSTVNEVASDHGNWLGGLDEENRATFRAYIERWGEQINGLTNG